MTVADGYQLTQLTVGRLLARAEEGHVAGSMTNLARLNRWAKPIEAFKRRMEERGKATGRADGKTVVVRTGERR